MDPHNILYRGLRRLKLQRHLIWNARLQRVDVSVPLLGDVLGSAVMLHAGTWKVDAFRRLASGLPIRQVLDVGANEGHTLIDLVEAGLGMVPVLSFEPNPVCAFYLQRLIRANDWSHVQVLPLALADREACLTLELASENSAGASIVADLRPGLVITQRQTIPSFRLDSLVETGVVQLRPGFLLKIDVEGAELDVIRGSLRALRNFRPLVLCEVLRAHSEDRREFMRRRNAELLTHLRPLEYRVLRLVLDRDQRRVERLEAIREFPDDLYGENTAHLCDYAFVPAELEPHLKGQFAFDSAG